MNLQKAKQRYLQKSQSTVQDQHQGQRDEQERAATLQNGDADEQSHGPGTGIPHHQLTGCGIVPQITQNTYGKQQDQERVSLIHILHAIHNVDRYNCYNSQSSGQSVHAIGAVGHIHGGPYQDHRENGEYHRRQRELYMEQCQLHHIGIIFQKSDSYQCCHTQIQETFFVLAPWSLGSIVQKSRHHAYHDQQQVDHQLCA